jgi:hypothetical protein
MKDKTMTEIKEALQLAVNTQQELTLREQPESNRILIKALGQILHSLQNKLETFNADTTTQ